MSTLQIIHVSESKNWCPGVESFSIVLINQLSLKTYCQYRNLGILDPQMKQKKTRSNKKYLKYIQKQFRFRKPFQILVDELFLDAFNRYKHSINSFRSILLSEPKFFISKCCYNAYKKSFFHENDFVKHIEIRHCKHADIDTSSCILDLVKQPNKYHYFVATMGSKTVEKLKEHKNVPLVILNKSQIKLLHRRKLVRHSDIEHGDEEGVESRNLAEE